VAKKEAAEAAAACDRAHTERDEAEEKISRLTQSRLDLAREVRRAGAKLDRCHLNARTIKCRGASSRRGWMLDDGRRIEVPLF